MKKILTTTTVLLAALCSRADVSYGNNGLFTITDANTSLSITVTRDYGGNKGFGYYKYDVATGIRGELISLNISQGQSFTIDGLSTGDVIGFYTEHAGQGTIYSNDVGKKGELNLEVLGFDSSGSAEVYNIKYNNSNNGIKFSVSTLPDVSPAGQPLPGVLASVVIGLGLSSVYFRRAKKNRK